MPATATTGNLENAQRIAIRETRYVSEHNAPAWNAITHMTLPKGERRIDVPEMR